jgi:hypothetical protein
MGDAEEDAEESEPSGGDESVVDEGRRDPSGSRNRHEMDHPAT